MSAESDKLEFKQSLAEWREVVESVAALATVRGCTQSARRMHVNGAVNFAETC